MPYRNAYLAACKKREEAAKKVDEALVAMNVINREICDTEKRQNLQMTERTQLQTASSVAQRDLNAADAECRKILGE